MESKFLIAAATVLAVGIMVWCVWQFMATPVRFGKNSYCAVILSVTGREPRLEETVRSLVWLHDNGVLRCHIIILAEHPDEETDYVARALARDNGCVTLIENGEMPEWIRKMNC